MNSATAKHVGAREQWHRTYEWLLLKVGRAGEQAKAQATPEAETRWQTLSKLLTEFEEGGHAR